MTFKKITSVAITGNSSGSPVGIKTTVTGPGQVVYDPLQSKITVKDLVLVISVDQWIQFLKNIGTVKKLVVQFELQATSQNTLLNRSRGNHTISSCASVPITTRGSRRDMMAGAGVATVCLLMGKKLS